MLARLRQIMAHFFHGSIHNPLRRLSDRIVVTLVLINAVTIIMESATLPHMYHMWIFYANYVITIIFAIEFMLRLWSYPYRKRVFLTKPLVIIDIISIFPALVAFLIGYSHVHLTIFRILRLTKLFNHWQTMSLFTAVLRRTYRILLMTMILIVMFCVIFSTFIYYAEHSAQPVAFANIPSSMWWCISTMTTVGYGDVVPVTILGKVIGALVSILGILLFALPAAILSAGFIAEFRRFTYHNRAEERRIKAELAKEAERTSA